MAYSLLDHPDLGDRRPAAMMAEMLSLRFETTAPDSLFLALFLRRLPASIRDHLAVANHTTATEMATHADILWDARNTASVSAVSVRSASPNRRASLPTAAPGPPIAAAAVAASRPAAPHPDGQMARRFAGFTRSTALTPRAAAEIVIGRKTRSPAWAAQCSRWPHLSPGFGL